VVEGRLITATPTCADASVRQTTIKMERVAGFEPAFPEGLGVRSARGVQLPTHPHKNYRRLFSFVILEPSMGFEPIKLPRFEDGVPYPMANPA
jgi:hypothetical protein